VGNEKAKDKMYTRLKKKLEFDKENKKLFQIFPPGSCYIVNILYMYTAHTDKNSAVVGEKKKFLTNLLLPPLHNQKKC
jgi:hypothetical protein